MSEWREPTWRIPRRGEIVKDREGLLGRVLKSEGTLDKRTLWVEDVKGTEIYSNEPAELFEAMDVETTGKFQTERYNLKGFKIGALCSYKGDTDVPLEILQMDWNALSDKMVICLRDLRLFEGAPMKTADDSLLQVFDMNYPPVEAIFSDYVTGLKWRLEVSLTEKLSEGWTNCGSPWEFITKEDALSEVDTWKARLKIRRVASVITGDWHVTFPCWVVEVKKEEDKILTRVSKIEASSGSPGYFQTSLHAAVAMKMIANETWNCAMGFSQDDILP